MIYRRVSNPRAGNVETQHPFLFRSMPITDFLPFLDVLHVAEETSAREANKMLREGWVLLVVVAANDGAGGYPVYVLGKPPLNPDTSGLKPELSPAPSAR